MDGFKDSEFVPVPKQTMDEIDSIEDFNNFTNTLRKKFVPVPKQTMDEIDSILGLTTVEFRIQTDIFIKLKQLAKSKGTPVQALIRQVLTEYSQNAE